MKKILYVVNTASFFLSHRLAIAKAAKENGYDIHVATSSGDGQEKLGIHGFHHHTLPFDRNSQNPLKEIRVLFKLWKTISVLKPDLLHLVTIKPVIYGGVVNRLFANLPAVVAISGLGTVFTSSSRLGRFRRFLIKRLYSFAFGSRKVKVIFQNPDDKSTLLNSGVVGEKNTALIRGSGVDLKEYKALAEPHGCKAQVVMAARLLVEKGVYEFYKAAELLESRNVSVEMKLIGTPDPGNPKSLSEPEFESWKQKPFIKILGFRSDIAEQYATANIVCLPSYYGEGLPKSLIEAAACGRAIVTTDSPGCNYAIEDGVTGLLIPPKDHIALADTIEELVVDAEERRKMGEAGRAFAEKHFDINVVVNQHLAIYNELLTHD